MSTRTYSLLFVSVLFFLPVNVTTTLGIDLLVFSVLEISIAIVGIFVIQDNMLNKGALRWLLLFVTIFCAYKLFTDKSEGIKALSITVLCPPLIFAALPRIDKHSTVWAKFIYIYKTFFLVECLISITERMVHRNLLNFSKILTDNIGGAEGFRSYGMVGHPLQNALVVSTMMTFFLVSKEKYKYWYWGTGFLAVLCFEARSSIVANLLILGAYILYLNFDRGRNFYQKLKMNLLLVSLTLIGGGAAISLGLGSRLMNRGLVDDSSAQVRLDIWKIFDRYSLSDFLFGLDFESVELIMVSMKLSATENFWIDYLFRFGIIFIGFMLFLYYNLCKELYKGYPKHKIWFTTSTFILIASTNNSLSAYWLPLFIFLFSIVLFSHYHLAEIPKPIYIKLRIGVLRKFFGSIGNKANDIGLRVA